MRRPHLVLLGALLLGCASSGSDDGAPDPEDRIRVTYRQDGERTLELVSESFGDKLAYYSTPRADASRKFQEDDVMEALVEWFDDRGYDDHALAGKAPRTLERSLEVERGGRVRYFATSQGSPAEERKLMGELVIALSGLYNETQALQNTTNELGGTYFETGRNR